MLERLAIYCFLQINNKTMDGLKSCREAMGILNEQSGVLTVTTLKSSSCVHGCSTESKKLCNACTQTERESLTRFSAAEQTPVYPPRVAKWSTTRHAPNEETKRHRNSSPVTFEQERDDAIAELDSVIESYHPRTQRRNKQLEKNGGTWPKTR